MVRKSASSLLLLVGCIALLVARPAFALSKCAVVAHLHNIGTFSAKDIAKLTCIAQHASGFDPSLQDRSKGPQTRWGLFGMAESQWCSTQFGASTGNNVRDVIPVDTPGNQCQVACNDLMIASQSIRCARIAIGKQGFSAFPEYAANKADCDNYTVDECSKTRKPHAAPRQEQVFVGSHQMPRQGDKVQMPSSERDEL
ncbi:hypothetical protein CAOG_01707 [Capsaspora owczarzaki ATCC 30864]|uniref:Uncharacterized protein n=1 Tax=Capsaspora owczarzaki (strain ATCC 30864) TaxID=595528 RepID=A0A0D2VK43_CAPO3|nr:hypothetical protein CAOG_01707 [Capsaspora owczarzaki ATCC 30864]KJE90387.1 hypothetical protein CAOG_001707 [Capsaspora owczarzaki ATCC 30864]|eukprot:XP_004364575.1 hypothetical protein CAOG_01707 [Capsaspora owczarzaki ATCC 30864]